jgi:Flp pilus assembly protein CpaB
MKRRARAIAFGCAALLCAGLAAAMTGGYREDIQSELGPLRPVVVASARIPAGRPIAAKEVDDLLEVRRIPERFAPVGALALAQQAAGRAPATAIPAGAYILAGQLRDPGHGREHDRPARLGPGRRPVEVSVTGAEALAAGGGDPIGTLVDVIVTTEPGPGGGRGRTYVAASGVRLLDLSQSDHPESSGYSAATPSAWTATLGLTRAQALRLIQAENFARGVRLIAS